MNIQVFLCVKKISISERFDILDVPTNIESLFWRIPKIFVGWSFFFAKFSRRNLFGKNSGNVLLAFCIIATGGFL